MKNPLQGREENRWYFPRCNSFPLMEVHSFKTRRFQLGTRLEGLILQGHIDFTQCRKAQLGERFYLHLTELWNLGFPDIRNCRAQVNFNFHKQYYSRSKSQVVTTLRRHFGQGRESYCIFDKFLYWSKRTPNSRKLSLHVHKERKTLKKETQGRE